MGYTPQRDTKFTGTETLSNLTSSAGAINLTSSTTVTTPTITVGSGTQKAVNDVALTTYIAGLALATQAALDTAIAGLDHKASVVCASTANISVATTGALTIDGIAMTGSLQRVLLKNQSAPAENGVYEYSTVAGFGRASDADSWTELPGSIVVVEKGTANADTAWMITADQGGTLGTTAVTVTSFGAGTTYSGGTYITLTGTSFDLNTVTAATLGTSQVFTGQKAFRQSSGTSDALFVGITGSFADSFTLTAGGTLRWQNTGTAALVASLTYTNPTGLAATGAWDFTGATPIVATASVGTSTTAPASTAFVQRDSRRKAFLAVANASMPYTITASSLIPTAEVIIAQQTAAKTTGQGIILPAASAVSAGQTITVKDGSTTGAGTYNLVIDRAGSDTIDGLTTFTLDTNLQSVDLVSDGTSKWYVV